MPSGQAHKSVRHYASLGVAQTHGLNAAIFPQPESYTDVAATEILSSRTNLAMLSSLPSDSCESAPSIDKKKLGGSAGHPICPTSSMSYVQYVFLRLASEMYLLAFAAPQT